MCWACLKLNLLQRHCRQGWPMCLMLVSYVVLWSLCAIFVSKCLISLENLKWFIYNPPGITFILRHFRFTESAHHLDKIPRRWRKKSLATLPDGVKVGGISYYSSSKTQYRAPFHGTQAKSQPRTLQGRAKSCVCARPTPGGQPAKKSLYSSPNLSAGVGVDCTGTGTDHLKL